MDTHPLERVSVDVLAMFFKDISTKVSDKKNFVNFRIACLSAGNLNFKIKSAMLNIDVSHNFEAKKCSALTPYLTSINLNFFGRAQIVAEGKVVDYLQFVPHNLWYCYHILERQASCPRVKHIVMEWPNCYRYFDEKIFVGNFFSKLVGFRKLETLHTKDIKLRASYLVNFLMLREISTNMEIENNLGTNYTFANVTILRIKNLMNLDMFTNLTHLYVDNYDYVHEDERINHICLDFCAMVHIEKLRFKHQKYNSVTINLSSAHLRYLSLDANVKLENSESYLKLDKIKIEKQHDDDSEGFKTQDIFKHAPNLKKFSIDFQSSGTGVETIECVSNFSQITNLVLRCMEIDYEPVLEPLRLLINLRKLHLEELDVTSVDEDVLNDIIYDRITHLVWDSISCGGRDPIAHYFAPSLEAISKLRFLRAKMISKDWMDLVPKLVKIDYLDLTNCEVLRRYVTPPDQTFFTANVENLYRKTPVNLDKFIAKFNALRTKRVGKLFTSKNFNKRICRIFHLEEIPSVDDPSFDGYSNDKDSLQRASLASLLEKHNSVLNALAGHQGRCYCGYDCKPTMDPRLHLQFTFKSSPKVFAK
jgi:hypothetical protein